MGNEGPMRCNVTQKTFQDEVSCGCKSRMKGKAVDRKANWGQKREGQVKFSRHK